MKKQLLALLLWLAVFNVETILAQCPTSYTYNVTSGGTVTTAYNLTGNKSLHIGGNTNYTGTITTDATSKICIDAGSTFNPSSYWTASGYFNNAGVLTFSNANGTNGTLQLVNSGTFTIVNQVSASNAVTLTNAAGATMSFNGFLFNNNTANITNDGTMSFSAGVSGSSTFNLTTSANSNLNIKGLQSSGVNTINNAGTIANTDYMSLGANSTFNNSGVFTSSAQFEITTTNLTNTGQFNLTTNNNAAKNGSVFLNKATMYINFISFNTGSVTITNDTSGVMTFGNTVMQIQNSSTFTNYGTLNFQKGFQLNTGCTFINNNDVQMNNTSSTLVNNGTFTNNGYIYVNGSYSSNSSSTSYNNCTLIATDGMTIQGNANNYGYLLMPTTGTSAKNGSPLFLVNGSTFTNNGWVQGTNYTNTAAVAGNGNFYFTGYTFVNNNFTGTSAGQPMNFYDVSRNPTTTGSTGYNYFDEGWGTVTNTQRSAISPVSLGIKPSTCNALVIAASQNTECSNVNDTATSDVLLPNGNFSLAITSPASGNTYTSGAGVTYSFSGGSFKSQADYNGTSCARNNTNGNGFAIVSAPYTGSGNCSSANQYAFPGDAAYGVAATSKILYIAGNTLNGQEYLAYQQTVNNLTIGGYYTFYFYVTNMREAANASDLPYLRVRVGGTDGYPDGKLGFGPYLLDETTTQNSAALNGWLRIAYTFKATATTMYLKVTDGAYQSSNGDDWGITAAGIRGCSCKATTSLSVNCNNSAVSIYEANGATWLWTTTTTGRFYTSAAYDVNTDSATSHLQMPYIKAYGNYSVSITDANGCLGSGNITVQSSCGTVLASNLAAFNVQKQGGKALLSWAANEVQDNDYFDIERSADGITWAKIGTVQGHAGSGNLQYSFTDGSPASGTNYYRLKLGNTDGGLSYSPTRSVTFTGVTGIKVYPNPSTDHLTINFDNDKAETAQLTVIAANGRVVLTKAQTLVNGSNSFTIYYTNNMAPGLYLLKIGTNDGSHTAKFIVGR